MYHRTDEQVKMNEESIERKVEREREKNGNSERKKRNVLR